MIKKAVIDRFEGDHAVLLTEVGDKLELLRLDLPTGAEAGSWLLLEYDDTADPPYLRNITVDEEATRRAEARVARKLARLRRRRRD
jgi:hypothetical protein